MDAETDPAPADEVTAGMAGMAGGATGGVADAARGDHATASTATPFDPAVLARLVQNAELLQRLSAAGPVGAMNAALESLRPMLEKAGWRPAPQPVPQPEASRDVKGTVRRSFAGAGTPILVGGWSGPAGGGLPPVRVEPAVKADVLAAALAGTPAAAAIPPRGTPPLPPGLLAGLLMAAGLWLDLQWAAAVGHDAAGVTRAGGGTKPVGDSFRKSKQWRDHQLRDLPDVRELAPDAQPRVVVMEPITDAVERIEDLPGLRSKALGGALLPPARLITAPPPVYHTLWDDGRALRDLGVCDEDVALLETLRSALFLSWHLSYKASDPAARSGQREQLALTWARVLLDVRAQDLRRRAKAGVLTPAVWDQWDELTRRLSGDLRTAGWRLGTDADVPAAVRWAEAGAIEWSEVPWFVPSAEAAGAAKGAAAGRRWFRPPLLPPVTPPGAPGGPGDPGDDGAAAVDGTTRPAARDLGPAELARPAAAPTPWHDVVLTAAWAAAARTSPSDCLRPRRPVARWPSG